VKQRHHRRERGDPQRSQRKENLPYPCNVKESAPWLLRTTWKRDDEIESTLEAAEAWRSLSISAFSALLGGLCVKG